MAFKFFLKGRIVKPKLTQAALKQLVLYNPKTGIFTWKVSVNNRISTGDMAGSLNKSGYIYIWINYKSYKAHRLAWLYMTGEWPKNQIDHKDRNRSNNKWKNLRHATHKQNMFNRKMHKNNVSGYIGVRFVKGKTKPWQANIRVNRRALYLGYYATAQEASEAYVKAAREHFREFYPDQEALSLLTMPT